MEKQLHEMSKTELHRNIRYGAQALRKIEVGDTYDYAINSDFFAVREVYEPFISELRKRGATKTDDRVLDAYYNARWAVDAALDGVA